MTDGAARPPLSAEDERYLAEALALAREAAAAGEVPVGCVIVRDGTVVGRGRNRREEGRNALAHAEIEAIAQACGTLGGWRLTGCTLYVTLEPCTMCAGAILNARIPRVVIGTKDARAGAMGSVLNLPAYPLGFVPEVAYAEDPKPYAEVLREFFRGRR